MDYKKLRIFAGEYGMEHQTTLLARLQGFGGRGLCGGYAPGRLP